MDNNQDNILNAVQCVWEFALEMRGTDTPEAVHSGSAAFSKAVNSTADAFGISTVRSELRDPVLIDAVIQGWDLCKENDAELCFDWEYVPEFLCTCLDDLTLAKEWKERLQSRLEELISTTSRPTL